MELEGLFFHEYNCFRTYGFHKVLCHNFIRRCMEKPSGFFWVWSLKVLLDNFLIIWHLIIISCVIRKSTFSTTFKILMSHLFRFSVYENHCKNICHFSLCFFCPDSDFFLLSEKVPQNCCWYQNWEWYIFIVIPTIPFGFLFTVEV